MKDTIELKFPVRIGDGSTLEKVSMRRPTLGDLIAAKVKLGDNDVEGEARLIAKLCGLIPEDIKLLDLADYLTLNAQLGRFLGGKA